MLAFADSYDREVNPDGSTTARVREPGPVAGAEGAGASATVGRLGGRPGRQGRPSSPVGAAAQPVAGMSMPRSVDRVVGQPGIELPAASRHELEARLGGDLSGVRVHTDAEAAESAMAVDARAYAVGRHLVFGPGQFRPSTSAGLALLEHEARHALQQGMREPGLSATLIADPSPASATQLQPVSAVGLMRHPADKVLRLAARWLERRALVSVSKHVARHARAMATRAVHGVFRKPREIRGLVTSAVQDALVLARKHAAATAGTVLEEGGVRLSLQARGPSKLRWVIQKVHPRAIGTKGERVLWVVLDMTGHVRTAFPSDALKTIGVGVAGLAALSERTADASESVAGRVERIAELDRRSQQRPGLSWVDFVPLIGDVWGGGLNEGEGAMIQRDREREALRDEIRLVVQGVVNDLQEEQRRSFDAAEVAEVDRVVRAAIFAPLVEDDDDATSGESTGAEADTSEPGPMSVEADASERE